MLIVELHVCFCRTQHTPLLATVAQHVLQEMSTEEQLNDVRRFMAKAQQSQIKSFNKIEQVIVKFPL